MKKNLIAAIAICLVTCLLLAGLQALLMPKHQSFLQREGAMIGEYYREDASHDVIFVGDCEVYETFVPPTLFRDTGVTSYVRGSPQQLIWQSYYLLEETFKRESPRVVVFNVYSMRYGTPQDEAYNRLTLDGMEWSMSKIRAIYASMTEEESFLSYVFPLLRYHSRWSELSGEDFQYLFSRPTVSHNGYLMQTGCVPMEDTKDPLPLLDYTLPERAFEYLEKMRVLCEENGATLVLVKSPTNYRKYHWYDEWEEQIAAYAKEKGVDYYNLIPKAEEIGIDWSCDTYDGGMHLNVTGAEKTTAYFGALLQKNYALPDHRGEETTAAVWQEKLAAYESERNGGTT